MDLEQQLKDSNAEKLVLDQLYVEGLKNNLLIRKELVLKSLELETLKKEFDTLKKSLEELQKELKKDGDAALCDN